VARITSFIWFGSVTPLSNTTTRTASGVNVCGTVQLSVGVVPVPEMVTFVGNGTGSTGIPAKLGVTAVAVSGPFWNVRFQLPVRSMLKGLAVAQNVESTARGWQGTRPVLKVPWIPRMVVPREGITPAPN
jgi:hypothetical protein